MNMNDMQGTDFQKLVWNEVLTIPFGEVRSYKQICLLYTSDAADEV